MTNGEARFNNSLRPRKPEGSLRRTAQDGHLDSHTAPELWPLKVQNSKPLSLSVFFFALECERIFIKTYSIESRCDTNRARKYTVCRDVRALWFKQHFIHSS